MTNSEFSVFALHYSGSYAQGYAVVVARSLEEAILEVATANYKPVLSEFAIDAEFLEFEKGYRLPFSVNNEDRPVVVDWISYFE